MKRMLGGGIGVNVILVGLNAVLGVLVSVVLAKQLGAAGFGIYSYFLALVTIIAIPVQAGLPTLLVREVAMGKVCGQWGLVRGINRLANQLIVVFCVCSFVATALIAWARGFVWNSESGQLLVVGLGLIPCFAFGGARSAVARGLGRLVLGQAPDLLLKPLAFLLLLFVASRFQAPSPVGAMTANLASGLLALVAGTLILRRIFHAESPVPRPAPEFRMKEWLTALVPFSLLAGFNLANRQIGILVLGSQGHPVDVGVFRVAAQFADVLNLAIIAVGSAVAPRIASLHAQGKSDELQHYVKSCARSIFLLTLPAVALFTLFGRSGIRMLYGEQFDGAYPLLVLLSVGQLVSVLAGPVGLVLNMSGQQGRVALLIAIGAAINLIVSLLSVGSMAATGVALATVASTVTINVVLWWMARRTMRIDTAVF